MMSLPPDDSNAKHRGTAEAVAPDEEKREDLHGEPSAAQAVKDAARAKLQPPAGASEGGGELKGLDAPGFGDRSPEDLQRMEPAASADVATREEATVDAEFGGMDNDLIDMGDFGENGTGSGTQAGGAGERLRPTGIGERGRQSSAEGDAGEDE